MRLPLEPPAGTYDQLPGAARARRILEHRARQLFCRWGYQEVITPTFELDEVVLGSGSQVSAAQLYRFVDREGQVLALRPDWTPAVARLVTARMARSPLPLRLFYVGNVFRYDRPRPESPREFGQAGVELIGAPSGLADAEVGVLALEVCRAAGLDDAQIEIGHAGYVTALLDALPGEARDLARAALQRRDMVSYAQILSGAPVDAPLVAALERLPEAQGGPEVLERELARCPLPSARNSLVALRRLWERLQGRGLGGHVTVDLGLVKALDYYTGPVFEVYAPDAGWSLATGGRYDGLFRRFGLELGATGFAASVDRLLATAARRHPALLEAHPPFVWVVPGLPGAASDPGADDGEAEARAWELTGELRRLGIPAALDPLGRSMEESLRDARRHGAVWAVTPERGQAGRVKAVRLGEAEELAPWDRAALLERLHAEAVGRHGACG